MKVEFSGLCVFAGWTEDGAGKPPVKIVLTKSDEDAPHQPLLVMRSHTVKRAHDGNPPDDPADIAFVGLDHMEMLGWYIERTLTLPAARRNELTLAGSRYLVDLAALSDLGGGGTTLDPSLRQAALSVDVNRGALEAKRLPGSQPLWNYTADREIPGDFRADGIVIADRVEYDLGTEDPDGEYSIRFGHPTRGQVTLEVKQNADVWITNVCRFSQPAREPGVPGVRNRIEDFAQHYLLLERPPTAGRRFVPIVHGQSTSDETTSECVRGMARLTPRGL